MAAGQFKATELSNGWEFAQQQWLDADGAPAKLGYSTLEWLPAQVPGHVHLDLIRHGAVADPHRGLAELGCQWVDEARWRYRLEFSAQPGSERPRRVLRFEGLDTVATVRLNGEVVAQTDNMFRSLEVDVSTRLVDGVNELTVDFESAAQLGRERRARFLEEEGLPDNVSRLPERAFVRKAQYMFAWDWGPRLCSAGIWKPVWLLEFAARIRGVQARQQWQPDGSVDVSFHAKIEGGGQVHHHFQGRWLADGEVLRVDQPRRWWPAGMGEQALHEVRSVLLPSGQSPSVGSAGAPALDELKQKIGLRRVELKREPDPRGESFEFLVNGQPLWAVGANWIPDHNFPSIVDRARLRSQLLRAVDMNMNMLRVWGGGVYESDDFYQLCDELGLLVWQDFPFACAYVPDGEEEQAVLRAEAHENIARLRNHPSLALWCGNNENLTMWHSKWGTPLPQPKRYYGERLYDGVLPEVVAEADPERTYVASSPIGGENANDGDVGDQHYWDVWHGRGDWVHYRDSTGRFASEFGFAAAPGRQVWREICAGDSDPFARPARDRRARWHDKTAKGYETYLGYIALHYPEPKNLDELIYYSQLNQRDALRFGIEHYRRSDFCRGSLIWQLNDCWPAQSWAVLDSAGEYKAAAFELRRLYAPALVSLDRPDPQGPFQAWAVVDNVDQALEGELSVEVRQLSEGRLLARQDVPVRLAPGERRCLLEMEVSGFPCDSTLVTARFAGSVTHRLLCEPKDALLPEPRLTAASHDDGVLLRSDGPVVDLWLWDDSGQLQLHDNWITLPAGGQVVLRGQGRLAQLCARSLRGRHSVIV